MDTFIIIILCGIILILLFTKNNKNSQLNNKNTIIKTLIRQAARWSLAAEQDSSPMVAVLHANYGAGYLWALRDIATDDEIKAATGIDILQFRDKVTKVQDDATKKMVKVCPNYAPSNSYFGKIAGDI